MKSQLEKAQTFANLHRKGSSFVIPNPWDLGSARLLESMGFSALATTSAGFAFSLGKPDLGVSNHAKIAHLQQLCAATDLPVSADLQNGFGDTPEQVASIISAAAQAGVVGGSIEDATGDAERPIYAMALAKERIECAVAAAKNLPFKFTLTARAENFLYGRPDIKDTIQRLQVYQEAGADVLFAPGIRTKQDIQAIISSVDRPLNVLVGAPGLSIPDLAEMGVSRISLGGSLARSAYGALLRAAREILAQGTFSYADEAISAKDINEIFARKLI